MSFNKQKFWKVVKGAGFAAIGAGLAYLAHWSTGLDPAYSGLVGAAISVLANLVHKLAQDDEPPTAPPASPAGPNLRTA